jgi:hypothetical protein
MDDFQDGVPPATNEQPTTQDRWANMTPEDRFLMEQFERDENFRQQARAMYHQVNAGQYYQQPQTQEPQESELDRTQRRLDEAKRRTQELMDWSRAQRRPWDDAETAEFNRLESEIPILEREILRLELAEVKNVRNQVTQQAQVGQFQQQVAQRFAQFAQPRIQQMNVSAAKKTELYNKMWQIFTSHPFYPQIVDIQAADELMKFAYNELVVNHGAPKQRSQNAGRSDERYNDIETPTEDGPKDRFSHMPPELAARMRAKYGERPLN